VVEGGTLGGLTLHVSDLPELKVGGRGVFFLKREGANRLIPHMRGEGILVLDATDHVTGSRLSVDIIRDTARSLGLAVQ
jgi:hypothetical protein